MDEEKEVEEEEEEEEEDGEDVKEEDEGGGPAWVDGFTCMEWFMEGKMGGGCCGKGGGGDGRGVG